MPRPKSAPRKRTKKSNKGLTTKEKSQVATIAKKATLSVAEKKFMNPLPAYSISPDYVNRSSRVSVLGFANTLNKVGTGITLQYGSEANPNYDPNDPSSPEDIGVDMRELKMLRPYQDSGINLTTDNYTIEGREIMPSSASCKWRLSRNIGQAINQLTSPATYSGINVIPSSLAVNLPVICRMIRVNPKLTQTDQVCDPEQDLFLSPQTNNVTGVFKSDFDDLELLTYNINKRRYNVIEDKFFRIQNGLTIQYTKSVAALSNISNGSGSVSGDHAYFQPIISNTNANCEKVLSTRHMLSQKKGGKIFYNEPVGTTATENATAGQRKEYILWHFMYAGAESFLDSENAQPKSPQDLRLSAVPCVKFSDV
ncbi:MAG: putative capsid protein [Cressdnaviricota sp.]|nr:MAG: putative capsid protein [Cressdnaviricota sp.]